MSCEDPDCHCEDGIIWEREYASQCAWNLAGHTKRCFRYGWEFTYRDENSAWTITVSCDTTKKNPNLEPMTLEPAPAGFEPDEQELHERQQNLARMVENLRAINVAEFEDFVDDEYGTWKITARWSGPFLKDPRWPLKATDTVQ